MSDELLPYYNSELSFLRKMGADFAKAHPAEAGALGVAPSERADPHVERLIEGVAFLNARTRLKLDDDFPELCESMMAALYPHYLAPFPSVAVVELKADPAQVNPAEGYLVKRHMNIETRAVQSEAAKGEPCRFRTCYPVTLWPLQISQVEFVRQPIGAPSAAPTSDAAAALKFQISSDLPDVTLSEFGTTRLRLYLNGLSTVINPLYQMLLRDCLRIVIAASTADPKPRVLKATQLQPVGFDRDEGLIDYPERSFLGYRLLTEYFAFPEKFHFVDLELPAGALMDLGESAQVYILLNDSNPVLEENVGNDTLKLGCTPIINLYARRAEPIQLRSHEEEYRVVPDQPRPLAHEVHSIRRVSATSAEGSVEYEPFFSIRHVRGDDPQRYWSASRRPAARGAERRDSGTEVALTLVDVNFQPDVARDWTLDVEVLCVNRDLPNDIRFGGGEPRMEIQGVASVSQVVCLTRPTKTRRPELGLGARWRLLSHLSLNHLSLVETISSGEEGPKALREILRLYDVTNSPATAAQIEGLVKISTKQVVGRVRDGSAIPGFCRGLEVHLVFDETRFPGSSGIFLFASVLRRFLSLYCAVNSFVTTVAFIQQREGELYRWPPLAGEKPLL